MIDLSTVVPAYYYDQENGGRIPVFCPSMDEFKDFLRYVEAINHYGMESGIVKIIPPKECHSVHDVRYQHDTVLLAIRAPYPRSSTLPDLSEKLKDVRVRHPIVQHIIGSQGIYTQTNVEKRRAYTIEQWYELCGDGDHRPPPKKGEYAPPTPRKRRRRSKLKDDDTDEPPNVPASSSEKSNPADANNISAHDDDEFPDPSQMNANDSSSSPSSSQSTSSILSKCLSRLINDDEYLINSPLSPYRSSWSPSTPSSPLNDVNDPFYPSFLHYLRHPTEQDSALSTNLLNVFEGTRLRSDPNLPQTPKGSVAPSTPLHTSTRMRLRRTSLPSPNADSDGSPSSSKFSLKRHRPSHNMPTPTPEPEPAAPEVELDDALEEDEHAADQTPDDENLPLSFDYHCKDVAQYNVQCCRELERTYWRNLTFNQPLYGADMAGTLFDTSVKSWNVNCLDNILNRIDINLPGVNTPYLYFGMWKATFAWHVEVGI
ncbi:hypothetical protein BC938DRAFT_472118 [Jimgerdemannia flammicorona]|uniref:JmjC domain-containing protein n=1 Tax=Jimgerdemannia flammicorona TaxID=994334 RepID=A0A433Q6R7_9FUNG|nr:hypothetical protein BC938DRAFT_472118 [Jimgerdemannia flammicorona]